MSNLKKGFIATLTLLAVTAGSNSHLQIPSNGEILQSQIQIGNPAEASYGDAVKWLQENRDWVIQNSWSWWTLQVYMTELSPSEVNKIQNDYRDRAGIELFNTALERALNQYSFPWYAKVLYRTSHRYAWHGRIENGKYNMYLSMDRDSANIFKRKRGY